MSSNEKKFKNLTPEILSDIEAMCGEVTPEDMDEIDLLLDDYDVETLIEIFLWMDDEDDTGDTQIREYYFSNPDPYLKPEPLKKGHPRHEHWFDEEGHIHVKNLSAFWLPELTITEEIGGTVYTVTGSYEGTETIDKKVERILRQNLKNGEECK